MDIPSHMARIAHVNEKSQMDILYTLWGSISRVHMGIENTLGKFV
jgi:hypothetical protein